MDNKKPYIAYANAAKVVNEPAIGAVVSKICVDEPGQVAYGIIDYVPGCGFSYYDWPDRPRG